MKFYFVALCSFFFCLFPSIYSSLEDDEQELIDDNYDKWMQQYFNWLTDDQKADLYEMKTEGYKIDDFIPPLTDWYGEAKGDVRARANEALNRACLAFVDFLTGPSKLHITEFERIASSAYDPYTDANNKVFVEKTLKRLNEHANVIMSEVKDRRKLELGKKVMPSCVKVFVSSSHMIRFYNDKLDRDKYLVTDSNIEKWTDQYLKWLSESEKRKLQALIEEGASLHEIRVAIGEFYVTTHGSRLTEATKFLFDGCSKFAEYLLGEENAAKYKEFIREAAEKRQKSSPDVSDLASYDTVEKDHKNYLLTKSKTLIDEMSSDFKRQIARRFLGSCVLVFDTAYRTDEEGLRDHDEL